MQHSKPARRFIDALTGSPDTPVTFQTFDDDEGRRDKALARQHHGTLAQFGRQLVKMQDRGAGIFITVNETDLRGRTAENVTRVRALFADADDGEVDPEKLALMPEPSIVVQSKAGKHFYWLPSDEVGLEAFRDAQQAICDTLGTDPKVKDLPRVMRLPGSYHLKDADDPFFVDVKVADGSKRYPVEKILENCRKAVKAVPVSKPPLVRIEAGGAVEQARRYVDKFAPAIQGSHGDEQTFKLACELVRGFALSDTDALALMLEWNGRCVPQWDERGLIDKIKSAHRSGKMAYGEKVREERPRLQMRPAWDEPTDGMKAFVEAGRVDDTATSTKRLKPNDLGALVMEKERVVCDRHGNIYLYDGRMWSGLNKGALQSLIFRHDDRVKSNPKRLSVAADYIINSVRRFEPIEWNALGDTEVPFRNGVFDFAKNEIRPHRAEDMLNRVLPHDYVRDAKAPLKWLWFLEYTFGDDPHYMAKAAAVQELFGYLLLPHAKFKKAGVFYGESDTGKSVLLGMMRSLVGPENTCQIPLDKMGEARNLAPIFGKMLNLLSEIKSGALVADGGFKQLVSTEEPIQIDEKYKAAFNYVPTAKHMFATNNLPAISDRSAATFNRLLIIQFNRIVPRDHQDAKLAAQLEAEMPGIIGWAMVGAKRLTDKGGVFTEVPESTALLTEYKKEQNHLAIFVEEMCIQGDGEDCRFRDFWESFNNWLLTRNPWSYFKVRDGLGKLGFGRARDQHGAKITGLRLRIRGEETQNNYDSTTSLEAIQ